MRSVLLIAAFLVIAHGSNAQACNLTNAYVAVTQFSPNPDGSCNVTFNISFTISINSGAKWINIDISYPCSYSNSLNIEGIYPGGVYTITPWTGITCNNINCSTFLATGVIASIGLSNSSSNNHDQCYSPSVTLPVTTGSILPLRFISFKTESIGKRAEVSWSAGSAMNVREFIVQRKKAGTTFENMLFVHPEENGSPDAEQHYRLMVPEDLTDGFYQYRIVAMNTDGNMIFSNSSTLQIRSNRQHFFFNSNPCKTDPAVILPASQGRTSIVVSDLWGRTIKKISNCSGTNISLGNLGEGIYLVAVHSADLNETTTQKLVVLKK